MKRDRTDEVSTVGKIEVHITHAYIVEQTSVLSINTGRKKKGSPKCIRFSPMQNIGRNNIKVASMTQTVATSPMVINKRNDNHVLVKVPSSSIMQKFTRCNFAAVAMKFTAWRIHAEKVD